MESLGCREILSLGVYIYITFCLANITDRYQRQKGGCGYRNMNLFAVF